MQECIFQYACCRALSCACIQHIRELTASRDAVSTVRCDEYGERWVPFLRLGLPSPEQGSESRHFGKEPYSCTTWAGVHKHSVSTHIYRWGASRSEQLWCILVSHTCLQHQEVHTHMAPSDNAKTFISPSVSVGPWSLVVMLSSTQSTSHPLWITAASGVVAELPLHQSPPTKHHLTIISHYR